jgi:hypothetical protein
VKLPDRVGKHRYFLLPLFRLFYQVQIRYSKLLSLDDFAAYRNHGSGKTTP